MKKKKKSFWNEKEIMNFKTLFSRIQQSLPNCYATWINGVVIGLVLEKRETPTWIPGDSLINKSKKQI